MQMSIPLGTDELDAKSAKLLELEFSERAGK
jgi:hypothetical protein